MDISSRKEFKLQNRDNLTKLNTMDAVINLRTAKPCMTLLEIATEVGISKQRVHKILSERGLPTKHRVVKPVYNCLECGKISLGKFCSTECRRKWQQIPVICTTCGKIFFRNKTQLLGRYRARLFCSRECLGKWAGNHYGFKVHPENGGARDNTRERNKNSDYSYIWKIHLETGFGASRLSRKLNMPEGTINSILCRCRKRQEFQELHSPKSDSKTL